MGTLTAGQPRLASYCVHKLPTSCRLSSIPECCACADERSHAAAYSTYIDGVGYVLRGSRWQRYCWFCKEFWENRVTASGLLPHQTRIPEEPDQTAFLNRWYEFHQGYRVIVKDDGTEERAAVVGEDFRDVSPGHMPRTILELRAGAAQSGFDAPSQAAPRPLQLPSRSVDLEEQLNSLWEDAVAEESVQAVPTRTTDTTTLHNVPDVVNVHGQSMTQGVPSIQTQARRVAALRRELYRMRNGIERVIAGLRELGAIVPDHGEATERLGNLGRALGAVGSADPYREARLAMDSVNELARATNDANTDRTAANMQTRIDEARERAAEARRMREQAAAELERAEQEALSAQQQLQHLQREQRTMENMVRVFGTREDIVAQGDNYESPIGGMFNAAWERFRQAEETRREQRMLRHYLADEQATGGEEQMRRLAEIENMDRDVWGVPQSQPVSQDSVPSQGIRHADTSNTTQLMEMARDEVFDGQMAHTQDNTSDTASELLSQRLADLSLRQGLTPPTDLVGGTLPQHERPTSSRVYELTEENRRRDLRHILSGSLAYTQPPIRTGPGPFRDMDGNALREYRRRINSDDVDLHTALAEHLIVDENIIWCVGLPSEWFRRARREGQPLSLTADPTSDGREEQRQNIEAMAIAFQISARVRQASDLTASAQMDMLTRLDHHLRDAADRTVLWQMLNDPVAVDTARTVLTESIYGPSQSTEERLASLIDHRTILSRETIQSRNDLNDRRRELHRLTAQHRERLHAIADVFSNRERRNAIADEDSAVGDEAVGLDAHDDRPEAKTDEQMTFKMECAICYSQIADTACLPCGHLAMCRWCSDQHSPTYAHDRTRPRRPANCPVCRKHIKQKVRVFRP